MIELPRVIQRYVEASNAHDVSSTVACFAPDGVVRDEGQTLRGKEAIGDWIATTIAKYRFHFTPLHLETGNAEIVVTIEVSGTFDGSPVTLDYHFMVKHDQISSLTID